MRYRFSPLLLLVLLATTLPLATSAQPVAVDRDLDQAVQQFRQFAAERMENDPTPGMTIGFRLGDYEWVEGFGWADIENQVPAGPTSAYRLASVTKPMTAMGILALVEQGKIDLDAEVQTYVPYFPPKEFPVTVGPLLGHLGGIPHYVNYDLEGHFKEHKDTREAIAVFEGFDLLWQPGTDYRYSSYGYNLLGAVIEGASGKSYAQHMRDVLWGPLGMDDTRLDDPGAIIPGRVRGYRPGPGGDVIHSEFVNISSRFAAGGTRSTVPDLLAFSRGLTPGTVLTQETLDLMWTRMKRLGGSSTGYGMGWAVNAKNGRFWVSHGGGQAETRTHFDYFPHEDLAIAVACNYEGANYWPYIQRLYELVMGEPWIDRIYVGDAQDRRRYRAVHDMFNEGLAWFERYGSAVTSDASEMSRALASFNAGLGPAATEDQSRQAWTALEAVRQGRGVGFDVLIGSWMAARLHEAHGAEFLDAAHGEGPFRFFEAYGRLDLDEAVRFDDEIVSLVGQWSRDYDATFTEATRQLQIQPDSDLKAVAARLSQHFGEATLCPDFSSDLLDVAEARFMQGNVPGALEATEVAMELYPKSDVPYVHGAVAHLALGQKDTARELVQKSLQLDPKGQASPGRINMLAYDIKSVGQLDLGLALLDVARAVHPEVANLYDSTGEFYLEKGDRARAIEFYREALKVDPEFENAKKVLAKLESGEL